MVLYLQCMKNDLNCLNDDYININPLPSLLPPKFVPIPQFPLPSLPSPPPSPVLNVGVGVTVKNIRWGWGVKMGDTEVQFTLSAHPFNVAPTLSSALTSLSPSVFPSQFSSSPTSP